MTFREWPQQTSDKLRMLGKRLLSYRKNTWVLEDYPILVREQDPDPDLDTARFDQDRFFARILGWWQIGAGGETREEALQALREEFLTQKLKSEQSGEPLPRPGVEVPIKFASQARFARHAELKEDFVHSILELPWAFISDDSSLWDFHSERTNNELFARIREHYGIDVSDIESANIAEILDRISNKQNV